MFVQREIIHDTDTIEIDIEKGGQTIAAYVSRSGAANKIKAGGYKTLRHAIPYVYEEMTFTAADLKVRHAGEKVFDNGGPRKRLNVKIARGLAKLRDRVKNLEELQLANALSTGKAIIQGKDVDYEVDFQMDPTHIIALTGTAQWDDPLSTKEKDLRDAAQLPGRKGAPAPNRCIMGFEAGILWSNDENVKQDLDLKNYNTGHIDFKQTDENRATYIGHYKSVGISQEMWTYQAQYTDANGDAQFYLDPYGVIMGSTAARVEAHYGMIENLNHGTFMGKEFPDFITDPKGRFADLTLESGPLIAVHQPDAFVYLKVKVTA
tara:strand:- start:15042 stop:16001 length:960 start_codon:yes stop_codon:yes gene_type:complete